MQRPEGCQEMAAVLTQTAQQQQGVQQAQDGMAGIGGKSEELQTRTISELIRRKLTDHWPKRTVSACFPIIHT